MATEKHTSDLRFDVGAVIMCNMGPSGWQLGTVISHHYREDHWLVDEQAPYQVMLVGDHTLIYVPEDDARYCREATPEDLRITRRMDALAALPSGQEVEVGRVDTGPQSTPMELGCAGSAAELGNASYRSARCRCCGSCPQSWLYAELYSEHYRCAARNGLKVTRHTIELGTVRVGDVIHQPAPQGLPCKKGFMQCPTLARLPPGVRFADDGSLNGEVRFDPHRDASYKVVFVAVSAAEWNAPDVGIVRLELAFVVEGNEPPAAFDRGAFVREQQLARTAANDILRELLEVWQQWEDSELENRDTCDRMSAELRRLRELCELHPRLDEGKWWAVLGGYHMNVHKLLENTLFECELYLGYALTSESAEVRRQAEQNLEGCYQKRLLEAARFMWMDGVQLMMRGDWTTAAATLHLAAAQKDGWGWAVNYGDIWLSESAARLVHGAELATQGGAADSEGERWVFEAAQLLKKCEARAAESGVFSPGGHPWASEVRAALAAYRKLQQGGEDATDWLEAFRLRTTYWCAQVLGGAAPFPPRPRPRLEDAGTLIRRLPG